MIEIKHTKEFKGKFLPLTQNLPLIVVADLGLIPVGSKDTLIRKIEVLCPYCDKPFTASLTNVKTGNTTKCKSCAVTITNTTHGGKGTRLYSIYCNMKTRCYNVNSEDYKYYGGKGVTIHEEWLNDFNVFSTWAKENGYLDTLTIDRKNTDLPYTPSNCRWVDMYTQNRNKPNLVSSNKTGFTGITTGITPNTWKASVWHNKKLVHLGTFSSKEDAVNTRNLYIQNNKVESIHSSGRL